LTLDPSKRIVYQVERSPEQPALTLSPARYAAR
jgi:hypothetical protein